MFNQPRQVRNMKRTCNWAKRKNTEERCSDFLGATNYPLAYCKCETDVLGVTVNSTLSILLQGTIPTDDDDVLLLFINALIEALQFFFRSSASTVVVTTDVQLLPMISVNMH